jgi:hypothetical protein
MSAIRNCLLGAILVAAGCGNGGSPPPDASDAPDVREDGATGDDGLDLPVDSDADAGPDAGDDAIADAGDDAAADGDGEDLPDSPGDADAEGGGPCGPSLPTCPGGETCDLHSCDPVAEGTCALTPRSCPETYEPVCGCTGETHASDCERLRSSVAVDHDGYCGSLLTCGGRTGAICGTGQLCNITSGCGLLDSGHCVSPVEHCPEAWKPECACDGLTYANECLRLATNQPRDHAGLCGSGETCGGIAGTACTIAEEVCDVSSCADDAAGTCVAPPSSCPIVYEPACGCDGATYANDCRRLVAGAALDHFGPCDVADCTPECRPIGGGAFAWVDPCSLFRICEAACDGCTASCSAVGTTDEGWYAGCAAPAGDAGCGYLPGLITPADCG